MSQDTEKALADETDILVDRIVKQGVDCVIGGFPCQDISSANNNATGLAGTKSGLFWQMVETVRLVGSAIGRKPDILLENVAALFRSERQPDMGVILGTLAGQWGHTEWDCVSAARVGSPQYRPRAYIFASDIGDRIQGRLPWKIQRQREFDKYEGIGSLEDFRRRADAFAPFFCRRDDGSARRLHAPKRLHAIGNGNPPCVIRELMKSIMDKS